jgi:hypothetical protein
MDSNTLTAISTGLSAIAAVAAVIVSVIVYRGQSQLTEKVAREQSAISLKIHENQHLLSQRQLLIPLWGYLDNLKQINPTAPIEPDVLKVVNTLELVALCCEGGMVDTAVIKRTFRDVFMQLYDQVEAVPTMKGLNLSGVELLKQNRAAMKFYGDLKQEHMNRDALTK